MISPAMATALIRVTSSPSLKRRLPPSGPASSIRPMNARQIPMLGIRPGRRPSTSHCSSGTNGTYSAVMNADWLLLMVCRPMVCRP
ncbi:hypothetical protein D3C80_1930470 [compost metagenome]